TTLVAPTGTEVAGASFHDTSTVVGVSGAATGTVTYSFFADGTSAGPPVSTDAATIAGSGAVPDSTTTGALAAGSYSFEATYGGDATNLGGVSACERFVVLPGVLPALVVSTTTTGLINNTTLVAPTGTEVAGPSFHDTSTVVGASGAATGTVTYSFFADGTCAGTPVSTDAVTIAGSGAVPNSTTTGALAAGSYSFEATYSGDTTYLGGVSACEPFVVLAPVVIPPGLVVSTTTTGLINNTTLVAPTGTEVAGASFHDTSTVVGASGAATGTVTYSFFADGTCAGTPVSTDAVTIAGSGAVPNSTTTGALAAGSYSFEATYSGDTTYLGGVSACEPFVVLAPVVIPPGLVVSTTTTGLINNTTLVAPTGTEVAGASFHDTSTVVGASGAATGTVTYSFFADGT